VSQADTSTVRMGSEQAAGVEDVAGELYIYNDRVIATDGVDDKKIIVLNEETAGEINKSVYEVDSREPYADLKGKIRQEFSEQGVYDPNKMTGDGVIIVDQEYAGKTYDLNEEEDFNELRKGTDQTYDIKEGDGDMIVYMNGMNNDEAGVKKGAGIIEGLTKEDVSIMHNDTDGIAGDVKEYLPNGYTTKDVLNSKVLEDLAKNGDETNTVIAFSAGNEDLYKAMKVMELEGRELETPIDVISVGSPRSKRSLEKAGSETGFGNIEQYNDWKDPVANPKKWVAVGAVGAVVGTYAAGSVITGVEVGIAKVGSTMGPALGATVAKVGSKWAELTQPTGMPGPADLLLKTAGTGAKVVGTGAKVVGTGAKVVGTGAKVVGTGAGGVVGVGAVGVTAKKSTDKYHSFEGYVNRNVGGVKEAIEGLNVE